MTATGLQGATGPQGATGDLRPIEMATVYFRSPGPEDWSPRIRRGLGAARRLAAFLVSLEAVESVAGWPRSRPEPYPYNYSQYSMLVPNWQAHRILAAALLFKQPANGAINYHTWIMEDGTLDICELVRHPDPDVRVAIVDWASHELSDQEPGMCGFAWWGKR